MARFDSSIDIDAPTERVWAVWSDIARWPEWSPQMKRVEPAEPGPLKLGAKAVVEAEGAPASTWEVTSLAPGESFEWKTTTRGVTVVGGHRITPRDGGSTAEASIEYSGFMSVLFRPMLMRVARRNVPAECEGLKRRCEAPDGADRA